MYKRILAVALVAMAVGLFPSAVHAQEACPDIAASGSGVQRLEGQGSYSSFGMSALVDQPVIALIDGTYLVQGFEYQYLSVFADIIDKAIDIRQLTAVAVNLPKVWVPFRYHLCARAVGRGENPREDRG